VNITPILLTCTVLLSRSWAADAWKERAATLLASRTNQLTKVLGRPISQPTHAGAKTNDAGDVSYWFSIESLSFDLDAAGGSVAFAVDHRVNVGPRVEEFRQGKRPEPKQNEVGMRHTAVGIVTNLVGPIQGFMRVATTAPITNWGLQSNGFAGLTRTWSFTWQRFERDRMVPGEFMLVTLDDDTGNFRSFLNRVRAENYVQDDRPLVPAAEIPKKVEAHWREWSARIRGPKAPCHVYFADEPVLVAVSPALLTKVELARQPKPQFRDGKRVIRLAYLVRAQLLEELRDPAKLKAETNDMWHRLLWDAHTGQRMEHGSLY